MKNSLCLRIAALVLAALASIVIANSNDFSAQDSKDQAKFEQYRKAIKDAYQVDIVNFKDKIKGGYADRKAVTDYDLVQLIDGIKWEREHTSDSLLALEIAMDHLERIADYYTNLTRMEYQCESERLRQM
jgi:endoglucanase Acf2